MSQEQPQQIPDGEVTPEKTPQQLAQEQKQKEQEEKQKQQQRKRLEEQARLKKEEDIKKLQEALKGSLSGLGKTNNNQTMAYLKLTLAEKQLQKIFPFILKYKQIRYLDINTNSITDPSILTEFEFLVSLNLSKNQIPSLACFNNDNLPYLQILNLSGNKIKTLTDVKLHSLKRLNLNENQISQIQWKGHSTIEILELRKNRLRKLKGITNLKKLRELYVCENQITDFRGLQNVNQLEKLSLRNNKIKTFMSPFPHLPKLQYLNLRENQIASLQEIKKLPLHIRKINFLANPLTEELGQNCKKQIVWNIPHIFKVNKSDITTAERLEFEKQWNEKQAIRERQRQQKEAQQAQAKRAAEEAANNQEAN